MSGEDTKAINAITSARTRDPTIKPMDHCI